MSVGELGLFVLIAYAAGHLIAAIANALEGLFWSILGGMPSDWVTRDPPAPLSTEQVENLRAKIGTRLNVTLAKIAGLDRKKRWPISRQIYADVAKNGKPDRVDTFNGNYGLNRGLSSACLVLTVVALAHMHWMIAVGLFATAAIYSYRAYRFGVHYARENYASSFWFCEDFGLTGLGFARRSVYDVVKNKIRTDSPRRDSLIVRGNPQLQLRTEANGSSKYAFPGRAEVTRPLPRVRHAT
jgi:hypothetical protein